MKKSLLAFSLVMSFSAMAFTNGPQLDDISKQDVENISREFGANFSHTVVAAPETDGLWGLEFGLIGGQTAAPKFKEIVGRSGGDSSDFKNIYHAGIFARAHFPLDLFAEINLLPEQEISDVKIQNRSIGLGWNVGRFLNLPLDIAIGVGRANSDISFKQTTPLPANIELQTVSTNAWVGVSKSFIFVTPYVKFGRSTIDGDLTATANIFNVSGQRKQSVTTTGGYMAAGANFQLFFFKLGAEFTQVQEVKRYSAKLSFDF